MSIASDIRAPSRGIVLFLDFDGVISSFRAMEARSEWIDPIACEMIARLREKFGFQIVVSSTWRGVEHRCRAALKPSGLAHYLHADWRTGSDADGMRGREIDDWLARNGSPEYIILDDDTFDFQPHHMARLVKCDGLNGFLHEHYCAAEKLLATLTPTGAS